jgi:hypothetical protein
MWQNGGMEQKTISQYRNMLRHRAFPKAWEKFGAYPTLIGIIVAIIVSVPFTSPVSFADILQNGAVMAALILLLVFIVLLLWSISREPVIIYNEQQNSKNQLQNEIIRLKEEAEPKLQIYFDESSIQIDSSPTGKITFHRVCVRNISSVRSVDKLNIKLTGEKIRQLLPFTPIEMRQTNTRGMQEKHLNPNSEMLVDVIYVTEFNNTKPEERYKFGFGFEIGVLNGRKEVKEIKSPPSELIIEASGMNTPVVTKTFTFNKKRLSKKNPYGFGEKIDDQPKT